MKPKVYLRVSQNGEPALTELGNYLDNGWPIPHTGDSWRMNNFPFPAGVYNIVDVEFDYYLQWITISLEGPFP